MDANDIYREQLRAIGNICPELIEPVINEVIRNREYVDLIASENYPSLACQYACSLPCFNTKYAEGSPFRRDAKGNHIVGTGRYYGGCENIDKVEEIANKYAMRAFGAEHAYSQPHSGADANLIAYSAILNRKITEPYLKEKGVKTADILSNEDYNELRSLWLSQTLLSMDLSSGGHLTHGSRQNLSSKIFNIKHYPLGNCGEIDYNIVLNCARHYKPLILLAGYSACTEAINFAMMKDIADEVGAVLMVDMAHFAGLVAGGVLTGPYNPIPYADIVTTTTHKTLRGPRGGLILCKKDWGSYIDKGCPNVIGGPLENQIAAKAVAFKEACSGKFKTYAHNVVKNAKRLESKLKEYGVPVFGMGTNNHMILIDVRKYGITGRQAENILKDVHITCNRNSLPNLDIKVDIDNPWECEDRSDPNGAWKTSGIRIGTPAITTLGMGESEMDILAAVIASALESATIEDDNMRESRQQNNKEIIENLLKRFPLYPEIMKEA